jgi:hypothetical protein
MFQRYEPRPETREIHYTEFLQDFIDKYPQNASVGIRYHDKRNDWGYELEYDGSWEKFTILNFDEGFGIESAADHDAIFARDWSARFDDSSQRRQIRLDNAHSEFDAMVTADYAFIDDEQGNPEYQGREGDPLILNYAHRTVSSHRRQHTHDNLNLLSSSEGRMLQNMTKKDRSSFDWATHYPSAHINKKVQSILSNAHTENILFRRKKSSLEYEEEEEEEEEEPDIISDDYAFSIKGYPFCLLRVKKDTTAHLPYQHCRLTVYEIRMQCIRPWDPAEISINVILQANKLLGQFGAYILKKYHDSNPFAKLPQESILNTISFLDGYGHEIQNKTPFFDDYDRPRKRRRRGRTIRRKRSQKWPRSSSRSRRRR